jgi:hypothetical protein
MLVGAEEKAPDKHAAAPPPKGAEEKAPDKHAAAPLPAPTPEAAGTPGRRWDGSPEPPPAGPTPAATGRRGAEALVRRIPGPPSAGFDQAPAELSPLVFPTAPLSTPSGSHTGWTGINDRLRRLRSELHDAQERLLRAEHVSVDRRRRLDACCAR